MKIVIVFAVLCSLVLVAQGRIFPQSAKSVQDTPRGQIPVIQHTPSFAQGVLISISLGDTSANIRSILIEDMSIVSYYNVSDIDADAFPVIDDVPSHSAIIVSGLSREIKSFYINPQTGEISVKGAFTFVGTPLSLGTDYFGANDNQIIYFVNSTLYYVSLSSALLVEVDTGVSFPTKLNNSEYVMGGFNAISQGVIILQISSSVNYFAYYNSTTGTIIRVSGSVFNEQRFVPTKGLSGYLFKNYRNSFDTGHYEITPYNLLTFRPLGAKFSVPNLLYGSNIVVERLSALLFTVSYNHTATYLTQIFLQGSQVNGISHMKNNAALVTSIGASENYVFSVSEQQKVPNSRPIYTLYRYDYNGLHNK